MRVVLQRVSRAEVRIADRVAGRIASGFLLLVGFNAEDTPDKLEWMADKIISLRLFPDADDKMNQGYRIHLTTWHPDSFPVRVAIARKLSPHHIAADSAQMWSLFDVLEDYMGRDLFVPAEDNDYDMRNIPTGTVAVAIDRCCGWASGFSTGTEFFIARSDLHSDAANIVVSINRITSAVVNLGSTNAANFVWHEMFHVLGTGHGCGFVSIQSNCDLASRYAPTPSDIAYWELLMRLQPMGETGLVARSVAAAIIGEAKAAGLSLQNQRNRPIVDQVDVHHRTELARFNRSGRPLAQ